MKKCMKAFVSTITLGAAMSLFATGEAIYEIGPAKLDLSNPFTYVSYVDSAGNFTAVTTADKPLKAGDRIYFLVRLVALNDVKGVESGYYQLDHVTLGSESLDWIMSPPQIGIYVGETRKAATMIQRPRRTPKSYDSATTEYTQYLFDTVYEYTIEPGDLGLPIVLALKNGKPATVNDDESLTAPTSEYLLPNAGALSTDPWRVRYYENSTTNDAVYTFNTARQQALATSEEKPEKNNMFSNFSLTQCGFYAKTVDFADKEEKSLEWRTVRQGNSQEGYVELEDYELYTTNKYSSTYYVWAVDPAWLANPSGDTWVDVPAVALEGTEKEVIVGYTDNDPEKPIKKKVKVATAEITEGKYRAKFSYEGVDKDKGTATLILSSSAGFSWQTAGITDFKLLQDYLTCDVTCIEAKPELTLKKTDSIKVYSVTSNYEENITTMALKLTDAYTEDITVTITPKLVDGKEGDYKWNNIVQISDSATFSEWKSAEPLKVTIEAGKTPTIPIYVYGLGAPSQSSGLWYDQNGYRVEFTMTVDKGASFLTKIEADPILVQPVMPVITSPVKGFTGEAKQGEDYKFKIAVQDNYTDVNDTNTGYRVYLATRRLGQISEWTELGTNGFVVYKGALYGRKGDGSVDTAYLPSYAFDLAGDTDVSLWIKAPNGETSPVADMSDEGTPLASEFDACLTGTITVAEPKKAFFSLTSNEKDKADSEPFDEGEMPTVTITLSEVPGQDVYAFLAPKDTNTVDKVSGFCLTNSDTSVGILIKASETTGTVSGWAIADEKQTTPPLEFLDGVRGGTTLKFDVILCTQRTFDSTKIVTGWKTGETSSTDPVVQNVVPTIEEVWLNDDTYVSFAAGETEKWLEGAASIGAESKFTFIVSDPSEIDLTATSNQAFQLRYSMVGGGTNVKDQVLYGDPNETNLTFKFTAKSDDATLTLWAFDKDTTQNTKTKKAAQRKVHFTVSDKPYVQVTTPDGDLRGTFYEDRVGQDDGLLRVQFMRGGSAFSADSNIKVQLTVTNSASKNPGTLKLSSMAGIEEVRAGVYEMTVYASQSYAEIYISEADGTANSAFTIIAEVIDTGSSPASGVSWKDYFEDPSKKGQGVFTIKNQPPTLMVSLPMTSLDEDDYFRGSRGYQNSASNALIGVIGNSDTVTWSASDILKDLGSVSSGTNITVTWWSEGTGNVSTKVTDEDTEYTFTPNFKSGGSKLVTVTATDKDKNTGRGTTTASWYYSVQQSKPLTTLANGPASSESALSQRYAAADGVGQGHIFADGAECSGASLFELSWNCGLSKTINCYAWGYKATNRVDNGWLNSTTNGEFDVALDTNGKKKASAASRGETAGYYTYPDAIYDSFLYCWLQKVTQTTTTGAGSGTETSSSSMISTIFGTLSPERTLAAPQRAQVSMPTEEDKEGGYSPIMLEAIFSKEWLPSDNMGDINADGIPDVYVARYKFDVLDTDGSVADNADDLKRQDSYNEDEDMLPTIGPGFVFTNAENTAGKPFNAKLEIRGWGDGLNDAINMPYVKIVNVAPDPVYEDPAVNTNSTLSELEWEAYLQAGKPDDWSPERPTDPTLSDTDNDDIPDGYEYYIWYRAKVGYMDNGVHKYLTGRRYCPEKPYEPTVIKSEQIAEWFDPLKDSFGSDWDTEDHDWDGIPDCMEFLLSTNPFDFDTDGDGLPDGYEVSISKTDPLKGDTDGNSKADGAENTDNDSMAVYLESMNLIGIKSGESTVYYCSALSNQFEMVVDPAEEDCCRLEVWVKKNEVEWTTNVYFTTKFTTEEAISNNTYKTDEGKYVLIGDLEKSNTWIGRVDETNLLMRGTSVRLARGTIFDSVTPAKYHRQMLTGVPTEVYTAYEYNGTFARGRKSYLFAAEVVATSVSRLQVMHFYVYQDHGFDPRTAWCHDAFAPFNETAEYTHMDEFLSMIFWYNAGVIPAADMVPSADTPMTSIWGKFSTNPLSADSDGDAMPDGWEFYLMAGKYGAAAPESQYSPLYPFSGPLNATPLDRDNDVDGLQWPQEYSGIKSSARYGLTPTHPLWRNKLYPTDPWNDDTDGDGMYDGVEGGELGETLANVVGLPSFEAGVVKSHFCYNDSGIAGGMLNPLSVDTDLDGLPDPWETEFYGTYTSSNPQTTVTTKNIEVTTQDGEVISATTNETSITVDTGVTWNMDGMDGTVPDDRLDYDSDGLVNWQEYMVGAMRCWRYDDSITPWGVTTITTNDIKQALAGGKETWGKFWYDRLIDKESPDFNPTLANGYMNGIGAYFTCCQHEWDQACGGWFMYRDGIDHDLKTDYWDSGMNRYTKKAYEAWGSDTPYDISNYAYPLKYICCDPRRHDTDFDGMDDYYELFHGMNPMLGDPAAQDMHADNLDQPYDIIYDAYLHYPEVYTVFLTDGRGNSTLPPTALNNWWRNIKNDNHPTVRLPEYKKGSESANNKGYDFIANPWLNGIAGADPDGDNIVNQEESIMPRVQAVSTYHHSDPTPLWMTDTSYTNSLTRKYYRIDPLSSAENFSMFDCDFPNEFVYDDQVYTFSELPGFYLDIFGGLHFYTRGISSGYEGGFIYAAHDEWWLQSGGWMFSFEENEGYDSDHDFLSDYEEAQGKTKPASNMLDHDDPLRRQAMYFNGEDAFLQTPIASSEAVPIDGLASEARQNFLYYTVECWAKPDKDLVINPPSGELYTLVARSVWADVSGAADEKLMRRNFLIGIRNGRWYTCFDGSSTDAKQSVEITDGVQATTNWTHVAATYDGKQLKLYVNGTCQGGVKDTSVQPEHGVSALAVNEIGEMNEEGGSTFFSGNCITITVGAAPQKRNGIIIDYAKYSDYGNWYKGYIDEVRIWDGARSAADILSDCENRVRYKAVAYDGDGNEIDTGNVSANRQAVYAKWKQGGSRADSADVQLPAQLMYHWAFDHIAGAVLPEDLIQVPAGFNTAKTVTDAKARWSRPDDWVESRWAGIAVKSKVYTDNAWVPWINNTVSHLPRFDLTTLDSVYWSEDYAGADSAEESGCTSFNFPRSNEVYSRWTQQHYTVEDYYDSHYDPDFSDYNAAWAANRFIENTRTRTQKTRFNVINDYGANGATNITTYTENVQKLRFAARDRKLVGDDLLPMGGAYPRRISLAEGGMWDTMAGEEHQASDAWAETGKDSDNNGLPDWWEKYARQNYCKTLKPRESLEWDSTVNYYGVQMPAYQAYLRDLEKGLVKVGSKIYYDDGYVDRRDADKDGLPDWWEELYGLDTSVDNADKDPDSDGLSNYQEYILGELYFQSESEGGFDLANKYGVNAGSCKLDPTLTYSITNQVVSDYFLRYSDQFIGVTNSPTHFYLNEYFGEIVSDHDFMEDWWENQYDISYTSMKVYDPLDDKDGDGWSTWAECRASLWGNSFTASLVDKWTSSQSDQYVICRPQPIVGVQVTYFGSDSNGKKQDISGKQLIVRMTSGNTQRSDATFVVPPTLDGQTKYIGPFAGDTIMHGHLSPGMVNVNSIVFDCANVGNDKVYTWNCDWYQENTPNELGWTYTDSDYTYGWHIWSNCNRTHTGTFEEYKAEFEKWPYIELEGGDFSWESIVETKPSADLASATLLIDGTTIFGSVNCTTGEYELDMSKFSKGNVDEYVFRVTYTSRLGHEWPQTVYLSDTKELKYGTDSDNGIRGSGYVREGKNMIEAFMDLDEDGAYTAGEPYGVVQNVDVGWHKTPVVTIELKDTSHVVPRFDVSENTDDRTVVEGTVGSGSESKAETSSESESGLTKTIRISRVSVNDDKSVPQRTLATKTLVLDSRPYLSEADVLATGRFDLDCKWLAKDWEKLGYDRADIEKATYEISEQLTDTSGNTSNIVLKTFVNTFKAQRTIPVPVAPLDDAPVYANSPTFTFACDDETMTAYRLQIRRAGDKTVANLVYDSGITLLPGREPNAVGEAVCNVTPDIHMGLDGLDDGASYEWRVALYNAKYPDDEETAWSEKTDTVWATFQMDVDNENRYPKLSTGYGRKSLAVRYYGPATNLKADTAIYVEAFEGADFRGQPMARTRVSLADQKLNSYTDVSTVNALLKGLTPGTCFVRAYIDFNGNGKRDDWESWGYVNNVGKGVKAIYNPVDITVTSSTADWQLTDVAQYTLFIEDCDTNKNEIPDCLEEWKPKDSDGDGISDEDETSLYGTNPYKDDTDDDGMPDGYEVWADLDPTSPDSDVYEEGDVMAMALAEDGETVLRHAQVYAAYGFDPTTAVDEDGANTVPFTAIEKYGVIGYLDELGLIAYDHSKYASGEAYVNANGLWDQYALKGGVSDLDGDGIPDGWELYVMFGPNGTSGVTKLQISPWDGTDGAKTSPGDAAAGLDEDSRLTLLGEFTGGKVTDPWVTDTDGDNVIDRYYHDYMLWDAGADADGDGLSNYAEYLISKVFKFAELDPNNKKTNGSVVDYFRKEGELYYGEMFTDHDQVDDIWEQEHDKFANRYIYDPSEDDDGDGWCNFSEAKAGTHPGAVASSGVDGYALPEYPIPTIEATVVYSGKQQLSGSLVFQAWGTSDTGMVGVPDAEWTVSSESVATNATKYAGQNPGKSVTYRLGPGVVSRGTVKIYFLDTEFEKAKVEDGKEVYSYRGEVGDAQWYNFIQDYNGDLYTTAITNGVLSLASVQVKVGTVDYATGEVTIDFSNPVLQQCIYQSRVNGSSSGTDLDTNNSGVYYSHEKLDLSRSFVKLEWKPVMIATTGNATYCLADATGGKGHVREGYNKFVVFCDMDGSGAYTPGEPFGFVRDVDVGWQGGAFKVELTETSPVFARIDLRATETTETGDLKASDRQVWQEGSSTVIDISGDKYSALRKEIGVTCESDEAVLDLSTTRLTRLRVMRVMVNGKRMLGYDDWDHEILVKQVVMEKKLDLGTRSYLHEGDFLADGVFDADWATLPNLLATKARETKDDCGFSYIDVTNVTYAIVVGEGDISDTSSNLVFRCLVTKTFDYAGGRMAKSDGVTPAATHVIRPVIDTTTPQNYVYGARPTFRFAMKDGNGNAYNSYTAFNIKITGGGVTYETGLRDLPAHDSTGWYEWTLDEAIGAKLPTSGNYTWQVALYNAKYQGATYQTTTVTEWSTTGTFTVNMNNQQDMNDHGYSSIAAVVKYAGPSLVLKKGTCIVQAFETADFAGNPAGQSYVTDDIDETASIVANAAILGLPQTGTYYLRAFIDMDGDRTLDDFESWGAANEAVTLTADVVTMPTVGIYIEDADTDGDWLPDAWEYAKYGNLTSLKGEIIGGDKIVFSSTFSTSTAGISTGLSGASLTIFQNPIAKDLLPDFDFTKSVSLATIRAAVEKNGNPTTVKITALTLSPDGDTVTLSVAAEVTDSIAGELLSSLYNLTNLKTRTADVTIHVYQKMSLATDKWTEIGPKDATGKYTGFAATVGADQVEIAVDVSKAGIDMTSGFYKIEVVQ